MKYDAISEKLNDVAMSGFAEEEYGSCQVEGFWAALIITDSLYGIIREDDYGFVEYWTYETEKETRELWEAQVTEWHQFFHPEAAYA
jgi:hypothetical protein